MDFIKNINKGVNVLNDINIINRKRNYANSILSSEPDQRNISSIREHCINKLHIQRAKSVFFKVFLPFLLVILFAYMGVENYLVYLGIGAWIIIGGIWSMLDGVSHSLKEHNLGRSATISIDDCGFN